MHPKPNNNLLVCGVALAVLFGAPAVFGQSLIPSGSEDSSAVKIGSAEPAVASAADADAPVVKSLFFTEDEMAALRRAIAVYTKNSLNNTNGNEGEDFLRQLDGNKANDKLPKLYTYPQFFLESLVYHSPKHWTIQVNHQRITPETKPGGVGSIRVLEISKDKALLEWQPAEADLVKMREIWDKAHDDRVDIDRGTGIIKFPLHANQTFSAFAMQVLEGKVQPVTIRNTPANSAGANQPPLKNTVPVQPEVPPAPNAETGLPGLLDRYKNLGQENKP